MAKARRSVKRISANIQPPLVLKVPHNPSTGTTVRLKDVGTGPPHPTHMKTKSTCSRIKIHSSPVESSEPYPYPRESKTFRRGGQGSRDPGAIDDVNYLHARGKRGVGRVSRIGHSLVRFYIIVLSSQRLGDLNEGTANNLHQKRES